MFSDPMVVDSFSEVFPISLHQVQHPIKVKGLTLDYNTSQVIHFDRMLNLVKGDRKDFRETVNYHRIRKHKDKTVTTELQSKMYRFTYTKRVIIGDGYTVPYGYLA